MAISLSRAARQAGRAPAARRALWSGYALLAAFDN